MQVADDGDKGFRKSSALDAAIDVYVKTGESSTLKVLYQPKKSEAEMVEAMTEIAKRSFPDRHSAIKAWVEAGLQLPPEPASPSALDVARTKGNQVTIAELLRAGAEVNLGDEKRSNQTAVPSPRLSAPKP